jgi:topoisomerase IV subunit B
MATGKLPEADNQKKNISLLTQNVPFTMAKEKETTDLFKYDEDSIKSLDWKEHIRLRPGMYIGKLGDGSSPDDGIY